MFRFLTGTAEVGLTAFGMDEIFERDGFAEEIHGGEHLFFGGKLERRGRVWRECIGFISLKNASRLSST